MVYRTKGTCASKIDLDIDRDHIIRSVRFTGGCNGNLQGISKLVVGRKAEEVIDRIWSEQKENHDSNSDGYKMTHPDVIVVDPPRKGCDELCLSTMLKMQPDRIVYVSCDSATLARDLKILCAPASEGQSSYRLEQVRACDMFPHSVHVESVVKLTRARA